jgi:plastocyanin
MGRPRRAWGPRALAVGALLSILPLAAWQPAPPSVTSALPRHVMAEHAHASLALAAPAEGITDSQAATLRVRLNTLLAEHVYLAARASGAALAGQQAGFEAAAGALVGGDSNDIADAIGAAYGPEAREAFLPLWNSHINMVVDYVKGLAADDQAMQQKAVNDLVGYTEDFGAFLSGANENLPKDAVAELVKVHALTLKDVIDAQAAGDPVKHFAALRMAAGHMGMIADPLAEATAAKFPDKFGAGAAAMPAPGMPSHGSGMSHGASAPARAGIQAEIKQFKFSPDPIEAAVGTTVTWTNQDGAQHSVTRQGGGFDSGLFQQGGTFSHTFDQPGTYDYFCARHPSMQGSVKVS